jgi:hypothetical protein
MVKIVHCLIVLLALSAIVCQTPERNSTHHSAGQSQTPITLFHAPRLPDVADTQNPYPVEIRCLLGPAPRSGQLVYSVANEKGETTTEHRIDLRPLDSGLAWTAEVPPQRAGSIVNYYFAFTNSNGQAVRHPNREPASYRFRVRALRVVGVSVPRGSAYSDKPLRVSLQVQSESRPSAEMVFRLIPATAEAAGERRIPLSIVEEQTAAKPTTYRLEAPAPDLQPGQIAELFFQLRTSEGAGERVPSDAPARVYSIKRSASSLKTIAGDGAFVMDTGSLRGRRFIALKGGGVWIEKPDNQSEHWGLENGLLSGLARFAVPDDINNRLYIGTERGVMSLEFGGTSLIGVATPNASSWGEELPGLKRLGNERRAGPATLSTLDGSLIFQLQREQVMETTFPVASFFEFRDDKLEELVFPSLNQPLVGMSSATFDPVDGCSLIGAFVNDGKQLRPMILRRCGPDVEQIPLQDFKLKDISVRPARITALTRDPVSGGLAAGLEFTLTDPQGKRRKDFGVYSVDESSGRLTPVIADLATTGAEVTSLATDWANKRILVGTFGKGLLYVQGGKVEPQTDAGGLLREITVVKIDAGSGAVMVGTSRGAHDFTNGAVRTFTFGPRGDGPLLTDALPMDQDLSTGRVLLSSYSSGLFQLERDRSDGWRVAESMKEGAELPAGIFGDSQYGPSNSIVAIMHSKGLLRIQNKQVTLLSTDAGIQDVNTLLRLLVRRSGEIWLASTPLPFGQSAGSNLQIIRDGRVLRTNKIPSREPATIARWVEVPERNSVFAATRAGVVEFNNTGAMTLLSTDSVSSITREPQTGLIGVAGTTVQRWDGKRFVPFLFRVDHPRARQGQLQAGVPIDIGIDRNGLWYLLYNGGILAVINSEGQSIKVLDPEDGIPSTARRLLVHSRSGDVIVGSANEGLAIVLSQERPR